MTSWVLLLIVIVPGILDVVYQYICSSVANVGEAVLVVFPGLVVDEEVSALLRVLLGAWIQP